MANPAWKTAAEIADGYTAINTTFLKRYQAHELDALQKELDKLMRETRSTIVPENDTDAAQVKNRRLLRLSQSNVVLQSYRSKMNR